ncbi:5-dehydro-2-deoxygluconokinase, partial [Klebsiella pneumoniae]
MGSPLIDWPLEQVVNCLVFYHPHDPSAPRAQQDALLLADCRACTKSGHEPLLEVVLPRSGPDNDRRLHPQSREQSYQQCIKADCVKPTPLSCATSLQR